MVAKRDNSATFEIIVVLAIVAIVAVTGQVLIYYESTTSQTSEVITSNGLTGFAVSDFEESDGSMHDLSIERIDVLPQSPLVGDPFEVHVIIKNKGDEPIKTPFIVEASFEPKADEVYPPIYTNTIVPKILAPGEEYSVDMLLTAIMPEGPLRIIAIADKTAKLKDDNPGNNLMSKTIIVALD